MLALVDPYILAFSAVTVAVTVFMGFWAARKSKSAADFFVAGRGVSVGWNASAISGEYLSAASFMGVAGMVMSSGYDALWYPVCYACGYLFLLLFIAGPLRRFGAYTIPDFAEGRYDSPVFRKIAVIFVLFIGFFYTMPQMKGAGTTLAYIFKDIQFMGHSGLPYWVGVVLVGAVITLNVALGGMKGITLVQAVQYWAKMFAISVPVFVLMSVYGGYGKQLGSQSAETLNAQRPTSNVERSASSIAQSTNISQLYAHRTMADITIPTDSGENLLALQMFPADKALEVYERQVGRTLLPVHIQMLEKLDRMLAGQLTRAGLLEQAKLHGVLINVPETHGSDAALKQAMEKGFAEIGIALVPVGDKYFRAIETTKLDAYFAALDSEAGAITGRQPLPAKAPKDETWLNPFGPLTTKAAKAAKGAASYTGEFVEVNRTTVIRNRWVLLQWWKHYWNYQPYAGREPHATSSAFGIVYECFRAHELSDRLSVPHSSEKWIAKTLLEPEWKDLTGVPDTKDMSHAMAAKVLDEALAKNGITVIRDPDNIFKAFPTKDAVFTPVDPKPYALLYTYSLIIALVCGTAGLPHILVRFYTNPDGVAAKRTTMWVMILIGVFYVFPPVFGVLGRNLMPELYTGLTGIKGTDQVVLKLPTILNLPARKPESQKASGAVAQSDSLAHSPIGSLPWGSVLSGITCAGAFAAFMSTFSGLLVSMTGALAHDVYGRILRPQSTPAERMRMFKWCAVLVGAVAILLGTQVEKLEINFMVGQAFAIAASSYFPLLFMSVWWRGMTTRGATTGMLAGGALAMAAISLTSFSTLAAGTDPTAAFFAVFKPLNDFWPLHPLLRILCEQPAIWAVPLAIALMVVVSKLTRREVPADIRMKMLVLHAPEALGLKQEYIREHEGAH